MMNQGSKVPGLSLGGLGGFGGGASKGGQDS